jgi:hypothetical protein
MMGDDFYNDVADEDDNSEDESSNGYASGFDDGDDGSSLVADYDMDEEYSEHDEY